MFKCFCYLYSMRTIRRRSHYTSINKGAYHEIFWSWVSTLSNDSGTGQGKLLNLGNLTVSEVWQGSEQRGESEGGRRKEEERSRGKKGTGVEGKEEKKREVREEKHGQERGWETSEESERRTEEIKEKGEEEKREKGLLAEARQGKVAEGRRGGEQREVQLEEK